MAKRDAGAKSKGGISGVCSDVSMKKKKKTVAKENRGGIG